MDFSKFKLNGVSFSEKDGKVECTLDQCGIKATYPYEKAEFVRPAECILTDLDGTTVKSEEFWIYLIEKTVRALSDDSFRLRSEDIPFVSGFSTIEHLTYCLNKYGIKKTALEANAVYHEIAKKELDDILRGKGNIGAFSPRPHLKEFLLEIKNRGIKIGLATSGLSYKAIPEIVSAFRLIGLGNPEDFYDAIITGGNRKEKGVYGNIGEMAVKPHPWVYAELALGLGIKDKTRTVVLEDSSSGLISGRLAGFPVIGFKDGNIGKSGLTEETYAFVDTFEEVLALL